MVIFHQSHLSKHTIMKTISKLTIRRSGTPTFVYNPTILHGGTASWPPLLRNGVLTHGIIQDLNHWSFNSEANVRQSALSISPCDKLNIVIVINGNRYYFLFSIAPITEIVQQAISSDGGGAMLCYICGHFTCIQIQRLKEPNTCLISIGIKFT